MNRNMKQWLSDMISADRKTALPILSFPSVSLLGITVRELISDSDRQAEGMKRVTERVNAAAAVSLMDLSVEAECFGATIRVSDEEVPTVVGRLVNDEDEANALEIPAVGAARSGLYVESIRKAVQIITDRPVLAGIIGPFSLAGRLLDVTEIMMDCYDEPDMVHTVLEKCTAFLIEYAKAYKAAGADGIMMAEPVSGLLSPALEEEFSSPYVKQIVDAVQDDEFIICYHNCGDNTPMMVESILSTGAAAYHFGDAIDLKEMFEGAPADALMLRTLPPDGLENAAMTLLSDSSYPVERLVERLLLAGYTRTSQVEGPGQFALRGGILDVFPAGDTQPIRAEFWGDDVDSLGRFDPLTQRKIEQISECFLPPAREVLMTAGQKTELRALIAKQAKSCKTEAGREALRAELEAFDGGTEPGFLDKYITYLYPEKECLLDYFADDERRARIYVVRLRCKYGLYCGAVSTICRDGE